jgi:hypothetical protein
MPNINPGLKYSPENSGYGSMENMNIIIASINNVLSELQTDVNSIEETERETLLNDSSTYVVVGDRRYDLKLVVDYIIDRGGDIKDGVLTLLNNDVSISWREDSNGDAGFDIDAQIQETELIGENLGMDDITWEWHIQYGTKIYGIPLNGTNFIEFDVTDNSINYYGNLGSDPDKFYYAVLVGDNIYNIPYSYGYVVKFNITTKDITLLDTSVGLGQYKWREAWEYNRNLYALPLSDNFDNDNLPRILKINTITDEVSLIEIEGLLTSPKVWVSSGRALNKIYSFPSTANYIIELNLENESYDLLGDPSFLYNGGGNNKFSPEGITTYNDKLYAIPNKFLYVAEINPEDSSLNFYGDISINSTTTRKWSNVLEINDKLYSLPFLDSRILEFNPTNASFNFYETNITGQGYRRSLGYENKIYGYPHNEISIIEFNPQDGSVNFYGSFGENTAKFGEMSLIDDKFYAMPLNMDSVIEFNPQDGSVGYLRSDIEGGTHNYKNYSEYSDKIYALPGDASKILKIDPLKRDIQLIFKDSSILNTDDASLNYSTEIIKK